MNLVELSGKIMIIAIIILFLVLVCVFFHHFYTKWLLNHHEEDTNDHHELAADTILYKGLDPLILKNIPVVVFSRKDFEDGLDCVVCLCDVSDGEMARILPKCNHGFHVDCIDMWFQSHSTCPLCRNPFSSSVEPMIETILRVPREGNSRHFPTNVLVWGNQSQINTFGPLQQSQQPCLATSSLASSSTSDSNRLEGMWAIDIPSEIDEEEESKLGVPMRMRLFNRLLSRDGTRI